MRKSNYIVLNREVEDMIDVEWFDISLDENKI